MSRIAHVRLGLAATHANIWSDRDRDGRVLYDRARLAPLAPLIVNHDDTRIVGRVLELMPRYEDDWFAARVELDDDAPGWITTGTPASFGYVAVFASELNGWTICRESYITEITIVSASHRPVEPTAQVTYLAPMASAPSAPTRAEREMIELRRRVAAAPHADVAAIIDRLRRELGYRRASLAELAV